MSRKKLAILGLTIVIIITAVLASFMYITKTKDKEVVSIAKEFYKNGWDKDIVAMIKEDIPVPVGFEYVTGSKNEGFVIKSLDTEKQYMWIPAKELSELNNASNYFNESYDAYRFTEEETLKSVNQYGGFYIELADNSEELYESLKNMNEETYNAESKNMQKQYADLVSVESNIINQDELASILTWNPDLISSIGLTSMKLGLSVTDNSRYTEIYEEWEDVVSDVIDSVPIPEGFSYVEGNRETGLLIEDNKNSNLQFVWVPIGTKYNVANIKNAQDELIEYAKDNDLLNSIIDEWEDCEESLPTDLVESVKEYGGFYMSVAELGYDNNGKSFNKYRGMYLQDNGPYANVGDYYRYVIESNYKTKYSAVLAKQKEGLTYDKAMSISKKLYSNSSSVVSHLTYGAEWDAAILWFSNHNTFPADSEHDKRTQYVLLKDSSEIGKYQDKRYREDSDKTGNMWNDTLFNRLWGLAGNLLELTQEKYNGQIVLRGGSWNATGADMPITSRTFMSKTDVDNSTESTIGFRPCLYIKLAEDYEERYDEECDCRYCDCDYCDEGDCDCRYCDCEDYYEEDRWDKYEEDCYCNYCDCDYCDTGDCDCRYCDCEDYYEEDRWDEYEEKCYCNYCDCDYCDTGDCDCRYCDCEDYYEEDRWDEYEEKCYCNYCDCDYCDEGDCDCRYCDCEDYYEEDEYEGEVNAPELAEGMIPVRHNGTNWVVVDEKSSKWYDYDNKQWANVMLSDGKYDADDVKDGQVIKDEDMGSMLVWIPRFAYSIEYGYHTKTAGDIDIEFLNGTTNKGYDGKTYQEDYDEEDVNNETDMIVHPAFTEDGDKKGFWVGKFESSKTSNKITIKPNKTAWTSITYSVANSTANNMKSQTTYGLKSSEVNTYLMRNSQWGAVAYLTLSEYGKGSEIYVNNSSSMTTGISSGSTSSSTSNSSSNSLVKNTYNTTKGKGASTTGNIYGIYDLSGGAWEYVQADGYTLSGTASNNYSKSAEEKGGAIYETSKTYTGNNSWYGDSSVYPTNNSKLIRGGSYKDGTAAGLFAFNSTSANSNSNVGFRVVLTVR